MRFLAPLGAGRPNTVGLAERLEFSLDHLGYEFPHYRTPEGENMFSHVSIWRSRPLELSAVLPYLGTSYLYKRSNRFWRFLIRHDLVHLVWRPLVEHTHCRHLRFRAKLALRGGPILKPHSAAGSFVSAGV